MNTRLFTFAGGETGVWRVVRMEPWREPLSWNPRLDVAAGSVSPQPLGTKWLLRGITSNERWMSCVKRRIVSWRSSQVWVERGPPVPP